MSMKTFIETLDEEVIGAFLFGSRARMTHHLKSDVDLYVVHRGPAGQDYYDHEGLVYQIQWRTEAAYKEKILKQGRCEPLGTHARILHDPTGLIQAYLEKSKALAKQGPKPLSREVRSTMIKGIKAHMMGLETMRHDPGLLLEINEITLTLVDLYYDQMGGWQVGRKHLVQDLLRRDPALAEAVSRCLMTVDYSRKIDCVMALKDMIL